MYEEDAPEIGRRYRVGLDDCCVAGWFIAAPDSVVTDEGVIERIEFDNGVVLTTLTGVTFTLLVEGDPTERGAEA